MTMTRATALQQNQAVIDRSTVLRDWIAELQSQVSTLTEQLAAAQALEQQDQAAIADLQAQLTAAEQTIAEQAARIQELEDELGQQDPPTKPLWGFNAGGYTQLETQSQAFARIVGVFGQVNVVRWWVNHFFDWTEVPSYYGDAAVVANLGGDIGAILNGSQDAAMTRICTDATRPTWLTGLHEPEDDGFAIPNWQAVQMRLARIKAVVGNPLVKFGPLLMGASYHATRYKGTDGHGTGRPAAEWLAFDLTDCDFVGADCYQWGTDDASADHAETVIGPVRDMAIAKGKHVVIGELGARRRATVSDSIRKRWFDETAAIDATNPGLFDAICEYETDRGAADKVPWNLLPPPGQDPNDPANSPMAVAAYRTLCLT